MTVLSKLCYDAGASVVVVDTCHEIAHTWDPSCWRSTRNLFLGSIPFSFRTYAPLYLISLLLSGKKLSKVDWLKFGIDLGRSTLFLSTNVGTFIGYICLMRHAMGFWARPTIGLVNGFFASLTAIMVERKSRRPMLALYLTNLASEIAYRMLADRGFVPLIKHGQVIVFAIALAGFFAMLQRGKLEESSAKLLRGLFATPQAEARPINDNVYKKLPEELKQIVINVRKIQGSKHPLCQHPGSCKSHVAEAFLRNFGAGFTISSAIHLVTNFKKLFTQPGKFASACATKKIYGLPMMLGCLPALFNATMCICHRKYNQSNLPVHMLAGGVSGLSLIFFENTSIAMYVLWKLIEAIYNEQVAAGRIPSFKHGDAVLYAASTAFCLYTGVVEPQAIRTSYWSFLRGLTQFKFDLVNRKLIDRYGFRASLLYHDFEPQLDRQTMTIFPGYLPCGVDPALKMVHNLPVKMVAKPY